MWPASWTGYCTSKNAVSDAHWRSMGGPQNLCWCDSKEQNLCPERKENLGNTPTFNCLSYPGPYNIGFLQCFQCITHSFLPNNTHALLPTIKLHGAISFLKADDNSSACKKLLAFKAPKINYRVDKSHPMQLVLRATWVQFICLNTRNSHERERKKERERGDRTVTYAVRMLKMLIYYLKWTSKYGGKSLGIASFRISCKPEVPNHPWNDEFCAVWGKGFVIIPYNARQLLPA